MKFKKLCWETLDLIKNLIKLVMIPIWVPIWAPVSLIREIFDKDYRNRNK